MTHPEDNGGRTDKAREALERAAFDAWWAAATFETLGTDHTWAAWKARASLTSTPSVGAVAPWPDFLGQPIRHGDRLTHPDGTEFVAVRLNGHGTEGDSWRCLYDHDPQSVSRLCLQIGDKGRAVLATPSTPKEGAAPVPINAPLVNPAAACFGSLCMQTNRCQYAPCQSTVKALGAFPQPTGHEPAPAVPRRDEGTLWGRIDEENRIFVFAPNAPKVIEDADFPGGFAKRDTT